MGTFCLGSSTARGEEAPFVPGTGLLPSLGRASGGPAAQPGVNYTSLN